jgi:hypothetical protein
MNAMPLIATTTATATTNTAATTTASESKEAAQAMSGAGEEKKSVGRPVESSSSSKRYHQSHYSKERDLFFQGNPSILYTTLKYIASLPDEFDDDVTNLATADDTGAVSHYGANAAEMETFSLKNDSALSRSKAFSLCLNILLYFYPILTF